MSNFRILSTIDTEKLEKEVSELRDQGWNLGEFKVMPYRKDRDFSSPESMVYEYNYVQTLYNEVPKNSVYGYGIVNEHGEPYFDESCVSSDRHSLEEICDSLNDNLEEGEPSFSVVKLVFEVTTNE